MLSKEEIKRYSKQILLPEIGMKGQEKIKAACVLVVGAGGLGCPVLQYLAAAGVGTIGIVDFDVVDKTNFQRQVLYSENDLGKSKAIVAAEKTNALNAFVKTEVVNARLEASNAFEVISNYDIVVDCTDNFETRYLVNDACVILDKPFVYAGIYKFEGQLSVFNLKNGPTYRCLFPETHSSETMLNCAATGVIGTLPGIIGTMQANEVLKMITGIGEVCSGKLILYNLLTHVFSEIKIRRNELLWKDMPGTADELKKKKYLSTYEEVANEKIDL